MANAILSVENLSLHRDGCDILRRVNLDVLAGEIHVLLGLNGSGKSTLAYTIMGCEGYEPDTGRISFDGKDLKDLSIMDRARLGITLAWQEPARFEAIPVGKYVGLGMKEPDHERVIAALDAVSLPAGFYGYRATDHTLSGGEHKRVELAVEYAIVHPQLCVDDGDRFWKDYFKNPNTYIVGGYDPRMQHKMFKDAIADIGGDFDGQITPLDLRNMSTEVAFEKVRHVVEDSKPVET